MEETWAIPTLFPSLKITRLPGWLVTKIFLHCDGVWLILYVNTLPLMDSKVMLEDILSVQKAIYLQKIILLPSMPQSTGSMPSSGSGYSTNYGVAYYITLPLPMRIFRQNLSADTATRPRIYWKHMLWHRLLHCV